ncbi:MAG: polysaccharide biosynthesis tyrosine autokinase [Desulfobacteraceae bacterium]|nr:polysaccharide biosynthesis tyrosine autokinase [Desulfobacteraceae bacterium]MBC2754793.1 polysaccharide biosynthesis tyrosine autokinase [Desulfobacteraceae bacterium]
MGKLTKAFEKTLRAVEEKNANISDFFADDRWDQRLRLSTDPHSPFFESFRNLRTPILYQSSDQQPKTILITSVMPNEGKGFVCANLGIALSQALEHHALIVDCDLRRPTLAQLFGLTNETGLVDHLQDKVDLSLLIRKTGQPKLSILPSGKPPQNPSELLSSGRMISFINEIAERYQDRIILFDSPPNIVASETSVLAKHLDGVILVVRHGASKKEDVKKLVDTLGPENILGLVYNAYPENKMKTFLNKKKMKYGYNHYYY